MDRAPLNEHVARLQVNFRGLIELHVYLPGNDDGVIDSFVAVREFHPDLLRVIEAATSVTVWPIFDRERNDRCSAGRVVLLGDACHPMRPFMGAGGAMAVEDGAILSRCLVQCEEPAEAFRQYEATRVERVGEVQRLSIENSWMRGPGADTDWFYLYDACVAPLAAPT